MIDEVLTKNDTKSVDISCGWSMFGVNKCCDVYFGAKCHKALILHCSGKIIQIQIHSLLLW